MTDHESTWVDAPRHILAIVNPASGSKRGMLVIKRLKEITQPRVTLHITTPEFDYAGAIAAGLADGADRILLAGGDGTLMEGVSGARRVMGEHVLPFSWVPVGTGNVVSGFLGLPHRVDPAIKLALGSGAIRRIDIAKVGDRCSVLRVSTGFEADAAFQVTREDKDRLGVLAYAIPGLKSLRQTRPVEYLISLDGQPPIQVDGILAFITATGALTWINGLSVINEAIQPDDGLLYAGVLRPLKSGAGAGRRSQFYRRERPAAGSDHLLFGAQTYCHQLEDPPTHSDRRRSARHDADHCRPAAARAADRRTAPARILVFAVALPDPPAG